MVAGSPPVTGNLRMWPLLLNRNAVPSRVQLGASKRSGRYIDDMAVGRRDGDGFESAVKLGLSGWRVRRGQLDFREYRLLHHILVVSANADANIKRSLKRRPDRRAGHFEVATRARQPQVNIVAALDQAQAGRR